MPKDRDVFAIIGQSFPSSFNHKAGAPQGQHSLPNPPARKKQLLLSRYVADGEASWLGKKYPHGFRGETAEGTVFSRGRGATIGRMAIKGIIDSDE
jgi:hypothetical protein